MDLQAAHWVLLAIMLGSYCVGTVLGFGTTILTVTFATQLLPLDTVLPVLAPINLITFLVLAVRHRKEVRWGLLLKQIVPFVGLGMPFGLMLFNLKQLWWLKLLFGIFVVVLASLQLRAVYGKAAEGPQKQLPIWTARAFLFGGGVTHGLFGSGGPMTVYAIGRQIDDKGAFRATLSAMWVPLTVALLVDYALTGLYTPQIQLLSGLALVPMGLGMGLGELLHARLEQQTFKRFVWLLLFVGGLILSGRALLKYFEQPPATSLHPPAVLVYETA